MEQIQLEQRKSWKVESSNASRQSMLRIACDSHFQPFFIGLNKKQYDCYTKEAISQQG